MYELWFSNEDANNVDNARMVVAHTLSDAEGVYHCLRIVFLHVMLIDVSTTAVVHQYDNR